MHVNYFTRFCTFDAYARNDPKLFEKGSVRPCVCVFVCVNERKKENTEKLALVDIMCNAIFIRLQCKYVFSNIFDAKITQNENENAFNCRS